VDIWLNAPMENLMSFPAVFQEGKKENATYYSGGGSV